MPATRIAIRRRSPRRAFAFSSARCANDRKPTAASASSSGKTMKTKRKGGNTQIETRTR